MQLLGPQKMYATPWLALSSSWRLCSTLCRLEWATTRRLVRRPTSLWWPKVGASFMRITQSDRSISPPLRLPISRPELVTREQLRQCIFRGCHERGKVRGDCSHLYWLACVFGNKVFRRHPCEFALEDGEQSGPQVYAMKSKEQINDVCVTRAIKHSVGSQQCWKDEQSHSRTLMQILSDCSDSWSRCTHWGGNRCSSWADNGLSRQWWHYSKANTRGLN